MFGIVIVIKLLFTEPLITTLELSSNSTSKFTSVPAIVLLSPWYNTMFLTPYVLSAFTSFVTSTLIFSFNLTYLPLICIFFSSIVYVSVLFKSASDKVTVATFAIPFASVGRVVFVSSTPFIVVDTPNIISLIGFISSLFVVLTFFSCSVYFPSISLFGIVTVTVFVLEL